MTEGTLRGPLGACILAATQEVGLYDPNKVHYTVDEFLAGLRYVESGSIYGDYEAVNESSGAYGAYQLVPKYLDYMVSTAGFDPADISDPAVQDGVAEYWAREFYRDFGNWDLVAVAWHAGASNARLALIETTPCSPGPAVTVEMIESAIPGESAYVEKVRYGAGKWREESAVAGLDTVSFPAAGEFYIKPVT